MIKGFFEVFNVTINLVFKFENISLKKKNFIVTLIVKIQHELIYALNSKTMAECYFLAQTQNDSIKFKRLTL